LDRGVGAIEVNTSAENVPQRDDAEAINLVTALEDAFRRWLHHQANRASVKR